MGIEEVAILTALQQFGQAASAYLAKIAVVPTGPYMTAAIAVGQQVAANITAAATYGLAAATAEFTTSNDAEKKVVQQLGALPPIS